MFPFDVILFDVGGVLLTNGWDHRERAAVLDRFHLDRAEFEARHATQNDAWERDVIAVKDYLEATVFYVPRSFSQDDFAGGWSVGNPRRTCGIGQVHAGRVEQRSARDERLSL
jgi:FMN phosphatase YigB (HAD superfamily)